MIFSTFASSQRRATIVLSYACMLAGGSMPAGVIRPPLIQPGPRRGSGGGRQSSAPPPDSTHAAKLRLPPAPWLDVLRPGVLGDLAGDVVAGLVGVHAAGPAVEPLTQLRPGCGLELRRAPLFGFAHEFGRAPGR